MIEIATLNVGTPTVLANVNGDNVWSGIRKARVDPSVVLWLSEVNLAGDGQADLSVHGGVDKAVYAYPSEHLPGWEHELEETLAPAAFGENVSTLGVLEHEVRIGDVWAWGSARLQVAQPRWPCFKLALHRGRADVQARMRSTGRTGWYLRVLAVGEVPAAGPIQVVTEDEARVSVRDAHLAMADVHLREPDAVRAVARHPALAEQWRQPLLDRLRRASEAAP